MIDIDMQVLSFRVQYLKTNYLQLVETNCWHIIKCFNVWLEKILDDRFFKQGHMHEKKCKNWWTLLLSGGSGCVWPLVLCCRSHPWRAAPAQPAHAVPPPPPAPPPPAQQSLVTPSSASTSWYEAITKVVVPDSLTMRGPRASHRCLSLAPTRGTLNNV